MKTKFILSADDYGPIKYINRGIRKAVEHGVINSVQVIVNYSAATLYNDLKLLNAVVPQGKKVSIGLHLTFTSGKPLFTEEGKTVSETWREIVVKSANDEWYFRDYVKFNYSYVTTDDSGQYSRALVGEFKAQAERLRSVLEQLEADIGELSIVFNSLSNHHDICTGTHDLFEKYSLLSTNENLTIRSPKIQSNFQSWTYYNIVLQRINKFGTRETRRETRLLRKAFKENKYTGEFDVVLKSPSYKDAKFYRKLGSLSIYNWFRKLKVKKRVKIVSKVMNEAKEYDLHHATYPKQKVIEVLFHLGDDEYTGRLNDAIMDGYVGVKRKYFEDRAIELQALLIAKKSGELDAFFESDGTLWDSCSTVKFLKN
ncbi:MAG: ChbG/HpnK family deacetylase [Crocinitomix sp.]|nr:ChbG/HpnK family deacetylase [Crocinitomix sp.]